MSFKKKVRKKCTKNITTLTLRYIDVENCNTRSSRIVICATRLFTSPLFRIDFSIISRIIENRSGLKKYAKSCCQKLNSNPKLIKIIGIKKCTKITNNFSVLFFSFVLFSDSAFCNAQKIGVPKIV